MSHHPDALAPRSGAPPTPRRRRRETRATLGYVTGGLGIAALGLGIGLAVSLLGTPEAQIVAPHDPQPGPDVTRAEPAPMAQDILDQLAGHPAPAHQGPALTDEDVATLERFPIDQPRDHPVLDEIRKGETGRQFKVRQQQRAELTAEVRSTARDKASRFRTRSQIADGTAVHLEHERLAEEQRRKEEAERLAREAEERRLAEAAEAASGTLIDGVFEGPQPSETFLEIAGTSSPNGGAAPVSGFYTISARWGQVGAWSRYHTGIDIAAPIGRPVVAAADGVVHAPVAGSWAGAHVIIEHHDGDATLYAHLAHTTVQPGERVLAGQVIGVIGMTGRTFGPHLHFEYYPSVQDASNPYSTSDPFIWLLTRGVRL